MQDKKKNATRQKEKSGKTKFILLRNKFLFVL